MPDRQASSAASGSNFALAILLLANVLLSLGPIFVRQSSVGPIATGFWRMALALPVLFVIARSVEGKLSFPIGRRLSLFVTSGLFFAADLAAWHLGIFETKLANANLLGNSTSFLLPLWSFVVARAWPSRLQGVALALAGIGAALLMGQSFELSRAHFIGDLLCLSAGIFYTFYLALLARARGNMGAWPVLAWSTLMSVLPLLLFVRLSGEALLPSDWTSLLLLALCSQILGQGFMIYAIGKVAPLLFGLTLLTQPVIAATVGWLRYGETLSPLDALGAAFVAVALILVRPR